MIEMLVMMEAKTTFSLSRNSVKLSRLISSSDRKPSESPSPEDPTVGPFLGPYQGPSGVGVLL